MVCKLVKTVRTVKKDDYEFKFEEFSIELENGKRIRIQPNEYTDSEGVKHSSKHDLSMVATLVK